MDEYEIIKKRKKEKKKVKISGIILISFIVLVISIMVIIVIRGYYKKASSITFNEEYVLYQYSANEKFTFTGSIVLTKNGEITKIDTKEFKGELDNDYPVYFSNIRNSCVLLSNYEVVLLNEKNAIYRIPYFSKINYDALKGYDGISIYHMIAIQNEYSSYVNISDNELSLDDSFLYDGNNVYLFTTNATINVGDREIKLDPLSYVEVLYHNSITIYNHQYDEIEEIEYDKDVIAFINDHKINLSTDTVLQDGENGRLLIRNLDKLPIYKTR